MWYFKEAKDRSDVKLVSGTTIFTVAKIERHDLEKMIKVYGVDEEETHPFDLEDFDTSRNSFCRKFKSVTHSRGLFVKAYDHLRESALSRSIDTSGTEGGSRSPDVSQDRSREEADSQKSEGSKKRQKTPTEKEQVKKLPPAKKTTQSSQSGYQNSLKIVGECVEVHISNLAEPDAARLVRPVDPDHVKFLTDELRQSSDLFVMLAGLVHDTVELDELKEPHCGVDVEVLGGNHTRIALQYLLSSGHLQKECVKVRIYKDLTNDEALSVGYLHNKKAEKSKKMTFMDETRLVKDKLQNCPPGSVLGEKKKLVQIFNLKNVTALNYNYKAHLALGTKASNEVWELALQIEKAWVQGEIKGVKKGRELKQTIFHDIYSRNLTEGDRQELLRLIISDGKKAFSKHLSELVQKNDHEDNEEMDQIEADREVQPDANVTEEEETLSEDEEQPIDVLDDNGVNEKDQMIRELREENKRLKKENERLNQVIAELKATSATSTIHKEADQGSSTCLQKKKGSGALKDAPGKENKTPSRKRRPVNEIQVDSFSVGDLVKAVWSGNKQMYKATIIQKHSDDLYRVNFDDDNIEEDRSITQIERREKITKRT